MPWKTNRKTGGKFFVGGFRRRKRSRSLSSRDRDAIAMYNKGLGF